MSKFTRGSVRALSLGMTSGPHVGSTAPSMGLSPRPTFATYGSGGRSSVSGVTATVFGCTGFVGRYVVNALGRVGSQVFCPWRGDELQHRHLKLMGDLGQIIPIEFELRDRESVYKACQYSNIIVNLVGRHYATNHYTIEQSSVESAQIIGEVARDLGIECVIHMSMANTSPDSKAELIRAKFQSEKVIRKLVPTSTIIRATDVFGLEDRFLNHILDKVFMLPFYPMLNFGKHKVQPVSVYDVAELVAMIAKDPESFIGKTVKAAGPEVITMAELFEWAITECNVKNRAIYTPLPPLLTKAVLYPFSLRLPLVNPEPKFALGDVDAEMRDNVLGEPEPLELTFADLNHNPHPVRSAIGRDALGFFMGARTYRGKKFLENS